VCIYFLFVATNEVTSEDIKFKRYLGKLLKKIFFYKFS
jgi:hypothetical protein